MHTLDSVRIEKLWGVQDLAISFQFDQSFNFIVGQNGTGKTTIINLIAAALVADFDRLDRIQFSKIEINLRPPSGKKRPSITITKTPKKDLPYFDIKYQIRDSVKTTPKIFALDAMAEERFYRGLPPQILKERFYKQRFNDIQQELGAFVKVSWLSVNRNSREAAPPDEREKRDLSAVDRKLASLHNELVRYFSQLSRRYANHTQEFQKNSFLSLLTSEKEGALVGFSKKIDTESERRSLSKVFELLGVESRLYEKKLETHLNQFDAALRNFEKNNKTLTTLHFAAMYNVWKTHSLVQHYESLQEKKSEIFAPKDNFVSVLNDLFGGRKTLDISERNEIVVKTKSGKEIDIYELSSGEKQLLIILGEALLQQQSSVVYIADEPELSLHVLWQEQLTNSIKKLNPSAQIVFATHSPDIVGPHADKIIDMEEVLG